MRGGAESIEICVVYTTRAKWYLLKWTLWNPSNDNSYSKSRLATWWAYGRTDTCRNKRVPRKRVRQLADWLGAKIEKINKNDKVLECVSRSFAFYLVTTSSAARAHVEYNATFDGIWTGKLVTSSTAKTVARRRYRPDSITVWPKAISDYEYGRSGISETRPFIITFFCSRLRGAFREIPRIRSTPSDGTTRDSLTARICLERRSRRQICKKNREIYRFENNGIADIAWPF